MAQIVQIQVRRGTAAAWSSANPILLAGEFGFETDTLKAKIGDGSTNWNSLNYMTAASAITSGAIQSGHIGDGAVTSGNIASGVIVANHLTSGLLNTTLSSGSVRSGHIASGAIPHGGALPSGLINYSSGFGTLSLSSMPSGLINYSSGFGVISSGQLGSGQVGFTHLSSGTLNLNSGIGYVSSGQIGSGQIASGHLASGLLANIQIGSGGIVSGMIGDGAVVSGSIASGQVGFVHLASGTLNLNSGIGYVSSGQIGSGQVASGHLASGVIWGFSQSDSLTLHIDTYNSWLSKRGDVDPTGGFQVRTLQYEVNSSEVEKEVGKYYSYRYDVNRPILEGGVWEFFLYLSVDDPSGSTKIVARMYSENTDTTALTELFSVESEEIDSTTPALYTMKTLQPAFLLQAPDYDGIPQNQTLTCKLFIKTTNPTDITVTLYSEGEILSGPYYDNKIKTPLNAIPAPDLIDSTVILSGGIYWYSLSSGSVRNNALDAGAVLSGNIGSGQVDAFHLASGTIIAATQSGQIGSGKLADGSVVSGTIGSGQIGWNHLASGVGFDLTSGAVKSGMIGNEAVLSGSVGSGQIGIIHIASGDVNNLNSGYGFVSSGQIGSGQIASGHLASGLLANIQIGSGGIVSGMIGAGAVVSGSIASGQIGWEHLASGVGFDLQSGSVKSGMIGNSAVLSGQVGSGQIGFVHLASGTLNLNSGIGFISSGQIGSGQIGYVHLASGVIPASSVNAFMAQLSAQQDNVTGDGTRFNPVCNTVIADTTGSYNSVTGVFTAPVTGRYILNFNIFFGGLLTSHTQHKAYITTSNREYSWQDNFTTNAFVGYRNINVTCIADMDAGDTAYPGIQVSNSTKVIDILSIETRFEGTLLNSAVLSGSISSGGIVSGMIGNGAVLSGSIGSGQVGYAHTASGFTRAIGACALNGFVRYDDTLLTTTSGVFKINPASGSYDFYSDSRKFTKSGEESIAIVSGNHLWYVYFDTAGAIRLSPTPWSITSDNVPAATVYMAASGIIASNTVYAIGGERHGYKRDRNWHEWAHDTIGARYSNGLTTTVANTTFSVTAGSIFDEDIEYTTSAPITNCRMWYRNTGAGSMRFDTNITTPTNGIQYDNAGALANVSLSSYWSQWIYFTNDPDYPVYIVIGQSQSSSISTIRANPNPTIPGLATLEWKLIYRAIFRNVGGNPVFTELTDYRTVSTGPANAAVLISHPDTVNRDAADQHPATSIAASGTANLASGNLQDIIFSIDAAKTQFDHDHISSGAGTAILSGAVGSGQIGYVHLASGTINNLTSGFGVVRRVVSTASDLAPTPNATTTDLFSQTAASGTIAWNAPTDPPYNGKLIEFRIKGSWGGDMSYGSGYVSGALTVLTYPSGKTLRLGWEYNTDNSLNKWQCIAKDQEA